MTIKLYDEQVFTAEKIVFNIHMGGRPMIGCFNQGNRKPTYLPVESVKEIVADSPANQIIGHVENQNNIF